MHTFRIARRSLAVAAGACMAACTGGALLPVEAGIGPNPTLPEPRPSLIPTIHVVDAKGWPAGAAPTPAEGLTVTAFARGLDHPRWLYVLPNGDVLVAETNAPKRPDDNKGLKGRFFKKFQKKAGGGVPSADRITLLRDADGDGVAETRSVLLAGLTSPFGMALVGDALYVANTDALVRVPYSRGDTRITATPTRVTALRDRVARRAAAVRLRRLEQQRRRERDRQGDGARRDPRGGRGDGRASRVRLGAAQSGRHGMGAGDRCALGIGERARRTGKRSRARLHDLGSRRGFLRMAVQLLRPARRLSSEHAATGSRREGGGPGLRTPSSHRVAWTCVVARLRGVAPRATEARDVRRPARLVEPPTEERL